MHLALPTFPDPQNPGGTITDAVASISRAWMFLSTSSYAIEVLVHRSLAAYTANVPPVARIQINAGEVLAATPPATVMLDYAGFDAAAAAAQKATPSLTPLQAQAVALYAAILSHPSLKGGTLVNP